MVRGLTTALTCTLLAATAAPLAAQREVRHEGFWIGFGVGGGRNLTKNGNGEQLTGGGGYVRLGGTVSEQLLLGGEIIGWGRSDQGNTLSRGNVTFTALFYPQKDGDLFLKAGIGGSSVTVATTAFGGTLTNTQSGGGETLGIGMDFRLGTNLWLTPNVDLLFQQFKDAGVTTKNSIGLITLGLTWH